MLVLVFGVLVLVVAVGMGVRHISMRVLMGVGMLVRVLVAHNCSFFQALADGALRSFPVHFSSIRPKCQMAKATAQVRTNRPTIT